MDGARYLVVGHRVMDTLIYQWTGLSFTEFQRMPTSRAIDWEHFKIDSTHYLAVANSEESSLHEVYSSIYYWTGSSFAEMQRIPTNGAIDLEHFEIDGTHYLAVANSGNSSLHEVDSLIYYWTGSSFAEIQRIPTNGAIDLEHFEIDGTHYLAVAHRGRDGASQLYYWTGSSFAELQSMPTFEGALAWEHFEMDSMHYLVVWSRRSLDGIMNVLIYRWTGSSWAELQSIEGGHSLGGGFDIDGKRYLVPHIGFYTLTSISGQLWNINSLMYHWTGTGFTKFQHSSNNGSLVVAAVAALTLVQLAIWLLLRWRCRRRRRIVCGGWWRHWLAHTHWEERETTPFESMLTKKNLQTAEQRFQDELAKDSVAWLGAFVCLGALTFDSSLVIALIEWASEGTDAVTDSNRAGGAGLLILLALWLVCRFGFKRQGSGYSSVRRFLLCLPVPMVYAALLGIQTRRAGPSYGSLLSLLYANGYFSMFVAPASPGIQVGLTSSVLYTVILVWYWENPEVAVGYYGYWYQHGVAMGFMATINFIKRNKEHMHREQVMAMQLLSTTLTAEKVQRCQAEFRYESTKEKLERQRLEVDPRPPSSYGTSQCRSAMTAPAATWALLGQQAVWEQCSSGSVAPCEGPDCLPENSLVQVEGSSDPRELRSVRVGDRVLCSDSLQERHCCYVEVTDVDLVEQESSSPVEWLRIKLSDGSFITMTDDHPLRVHSHGEVARVKLAAEVQPGKDSLKCMRLVDQTVVAVEHGVSPPAVGREAGPSGPPRRVSLTVQQGTRFSVLVSPAGCCAPLSHLTAVGSADAACSGRRRGNMVWEYGQRETQQHPRLKRTSSDPTHLRDGGFPTAPRIEKGNTPSETEHDFTRNVEDPEFLPELTLDCRPAILDLLLNHRQELQLELGEFWSVGSELHSSGDCTPCQQFQRGEVCEHGTACTNCHIVHITPSRARPNQKKRLLLRRFSEHLANLFPPGPGDAPLRLAVANFARTNPRFRELLREHEAEVLAAVRPREGVVSI